MSDTTTIERAAGLLRDAESSGEFIAPLREQFAGLDESQAYAVQRVNIDRRVAAGRRVVGYKIGLTSPAVQRQLGVDQPDCGTLLDDMEYLQGVAIPAARLQQPKVEAEIAFVLARDLDHDNPTLVDVIRAIDFALPALEIVGSRIREWNIRLVDTVADNASSSGFVLGTAPRRLGELDLRGAGMRMTCGADVVSQGQASACLGNPLNAVAWLARTMVRNGTPLRAGHLVLSGALGPMVAVQPGQTYEAVIDGLGSVSASFA